MKRTARLLVGEALVVLVLALVMALFPADTLAFHTGDYPGDPVHAWITDSGLEFIRSDVRDVIKRASFDQDVPGWLGGYADVPRNHFVRGLFDDSAAYINEEYVSIRQSLSKPVPDAWAAADNFGMLLHTAQDFYSHSNWVEIWTKRGYYQSDNNGNTPDRPSHYFLYESGLGDWFQPWSYAPRGEWAPHPNYAGSLRTMIVQTASADNYQIPEGHIATLNRGSGLPGERVPTIRVGFGKSAQNYDGLMTTAGGRTYEPIKLEHDEMNKDDSSRQYYEDAYWNAVAQTNHEWMRLLHMVKGSDFSGSSAALGYWLNPEGSVVDPSRGPISAWVEVLI